MLTDDVEIFALLEASGNASFDPGRAAVIELEADGKYGLLLFSPEGPYKGCLLFLVERSVLDVEAEKELLPFLLTLPDDHGFNVLKNEALAAVERMISRRNSDRLFFDAH